MRNWSSTVEYRAAGFEQPGTVEQLQEVVARTPRIRALGTRHSFNAIADTEGVLVTTTGIAPEFELDAARRVVRVGSGTRYAALATFLTDEDWALHNMGSLPHISVGGAVATGTHGSGAANGSLATAVRGLQIVGPDGSLRWVRAGSAVQIIESAEDNTTQQGVAGAWSSHLPHFRIDSTPSKGDEIQSEYFVDRADAADALRAVRALAAEIHPHLLVTELRTIAADRLWLSEASERDSLAIHFTFKNEPAAVTLLCARIEAALEPFAPRPHWGKVHTVDAAAIAERYPRLPDFQALRASADPTGKFGGPALDALIGAVRA